MNLGYRIRFFRRCRGVKVKELAEAIEVQGQNIHNWEARRRIQIPEDALVRITDYLEINRAVFFSEEYDDLEFDTEPDRTWTLDRNPA